jgi:membrane-associated protein
MLEGLLDLVAASPWAYAAILAVAALDAVFPVVPSEATMISAGVLAGAGDLSIGLVIAAGAGGALVGDNAAYWLGRALGPRFDARFARSTRAAERRAWAQEKLQRRGAALVLAGRFVPGGRTATTVTAGALGMRWPRFLVFSALAGIVWAAFAGLLGYGGGRSFEEQPYVALAAAFAIAAGLFVALELARRLHRRRSPAKPPIRGRLEDGRLPA